MTGRIRKRLTYANVTATLALFLALNVGAYAAVRLPANSVGPAQLRSKAVTPAKVAKETIKLFRGRKGSPGARGLTGAAGAQGPEGTAKAFAASPARGPSSRARRRTSPTRTSRIRSPASTASRSRSRRRAPS